MDGRSCRAVEGRAAAEEVHDFATGTGGTLGQFGKLFLAHELRNRDTANGYAFHDGNHRVAVTAHHEGLHVFDRHAQFVGHEASETGRVKHASHTDDLVGRETGLLLHVVDHGVQRVGDHDDECIRSVFLDGFGNGLDHAAVLVQEVVTAHARHTRETGGHDHDVCALDGGVVGRTLKIHGRVDDRAAFHDIESLALRHALSLRNIDKDHVAKILLGEHESHCTTDLTSTNECNLLSSHDLTFLLR